MAASPIQAEHLIVLATNDTHSQIEPYENDNLGGILRRRAFFDHMRANNKNVLIVDAGDAVFGNMYYSIFKGEVEYKLLDSLGYDISILGNHDFDNGIDNLAMHYKNTHVTKLSANYDFTGTAMEGVMRPYTIKKYGNKRVGIFGLNINPSGWINPNNYDGMRYLPSSHVADSIARHLKTVEKVDFTIMVSNLGYFSEAMGKPCDTTIAAQSHYIDMIIGGHTHTMIKPNQGEDQVKNADGKLVTIGQNGKYGKYIGVYDIDLDNMTVRYDQVAMNSDWDNQSQYSAMNAWLNKYRVIIKIQELMPVGYLSDYFPSDDDYAAWLLNAQLEIARDVFAIDNVTISIYNRGGIRRDLPQGFLTWSQLTTAFPFKNKIVIAEVDGKKLKEVIENINIKQALAHPYLINQTPETQNIKNIDEKKKYRIVTIDYLANGGSYMTNISDYIIFEDNIANSERLIEYFIKNTIANKIVKTQ